jgi:hypothetical protein
LHGKFILNRTNTRFRCPGCQTYTIMSQKYTATVGKLLTEIYGYLVPHSCDSILSLKPRDCLQFVVINATQPALLVKVNQKLISFNFFSIRPDVYCYCGKSKYIIKCAQRHQVKSCDKICDKLPLVERITVWNECYRHSECTLS